MSVGEVVVEDKGGVTHEAANAAVEAQAAAVAAAGVATAVMMHHRQEETGMPHLQRSRWQRTRFSFSGDGARWSPLLAQA